MVSKDTPDAQQPQVPHPQLPQSDLEPSGALIPLMEQPRVAAGMAGISGLINAWAFLNAKAFSTIMSGNLLTMAYRLSQKEWATAGWLLSIVATFGLGAAATALIKNILGQRSRRYSPVILAITGVLFLVALLVYNTWSVNPLLVVAILSFAAGVQGNAFHQVEGRSYSSIAETSVVQATFNSLANSFFSKRGPMGRTNLDWAANYFLIVLTFTVCALVAYLLDGHTFNGASLVLAAVITIGMAVYTRFLPFPVDPNQ